MTSTDELNRDPSRSGRKRAEILDAAQQAFFAHGYAGASMDQVAAGAAVSKQTVYKHFSDKESLFREVVAHVVHVAEGGIPAERFTSGEGSFPERLRSFARQFLRGVMQPNVIELRRLVIAEAARFPELGRLFYDTGPRRAADQLAVALERAATEANLRLANPTLAAEQLLSLVLSIPLDHAMLRADQHDLTDEALERYADEGVATFLRAYGFDDG